MLETGSFENEFDWSWCFCVREGGHILIAPPVCQCVHFVVPSISRTWEDFEINFQICSSCGEGVSNKRIGTLKSRSRSLLQISNKLYPLGKSQIQEFFDLNWQVCSS